MSNTKFENVSIKNSKNVFYLSSKTKKEGYDVEFDKEGETYYHKEFNDLKGKLTAIKLKDGKFGKRLCFYFEMEKDLVYVLEINVFHSGSRIEGWAKAFSLYLENLVLGKETEISLNRKEKDKKGYLFRNAYIKQEGEKVNWSFEPKDAPKWESVADKVTGEAKWDSSEQDKFYYDKIKAVAGEEQTEQQEQPKAKEQPKEKPKKKEKAVEVKVEPQTDDLPF